MRSLVCRGCGRTIDGLDLGGYPCSSCRGGHRSCHVCGWEPRLRAFEIGSLVRWSDPDDGISSGLYEVVHADYFNEVLTMRRGMSEAEAPFWEVRRVLKQRSRSHA